MAFCSVDSACEVVTENEITELGIENIVTNDLPEIFQKTFLSSDTSAESASHHLSKTEKKRRRYEELVARQKEKRKEKKKQKRLSDKVSKHLSPNSTQSNSVCSTSAEHAGDASPRLSKRDQQRLIKERLHTALATGQKIAVDLSLESYMSEKESSRLAQQLCRLYGSNRLACQPAHLYFTGLDKHGLIYKECLRKNSGFESYVIEMKEESHLDIFAKEEIVYLSPDSRNVLQTIDADKVYVIGGLVDESVAKNISQSRADRDSILTARLPIQEYMTKAEVGNYSQILTVNQVFDILLTFTQSRDWKKSLSVGVPHRKGFIIKDD